MEKNYRNKELFIHMESAIENLNMMIGHSTHMSNIDLENLEHMVATLKMAIIQAEAMSKALTTANLRIINYESKTS